MGRAGDTPLTKGSPEHLRRITAAIDDTALVAARADTDWITHGQTYAEGSVSRCRPDQSRQRPEVRLAWTLELGGRRGMQATPLVVDGIMFFTGSWSIVYAVDVRKGSIIWRFDPEVDRSKAPSFCCGVNNRGVALYRGAVFVGTLDGRLLYLDASDGSVNWSVLTIPENSNYSITGAPRIVKGKVLIGNGGAEYAGVPVTSRRTMPALGSRRGASTPFRATPRRRLRIRRWNVPQRRGAANGGCRAGVEPSGIRWSMIRS